MLRWVFLILALTAAPGHAYEELTRASTMSKTGYDEFVFLGWGSACSVAVQYFSYPPLGSGLSGQPDYWLIGVHKIEPGYVDVQTDWEDKGISAQAWDRARASQATEAALKRGYGPDGYVETIRDAPAASRPGLAEVLQSTESFHLSYMTDWPARDFRLSNVYYSPLSNCALLVFRNQNTPRDSYRWKLLRLLDPGVRRTRARAHVTNGLLLYKEEADIYAAEEELAIASQMDPGYPLGLFYHAQILSLHGRFEEALARLETAVKLKPEYKRKAREAVEFEAMWKDSRFHAIVGKKSLLDLKP